MQIKMISPLNSHLLRQAAQRQAEESMTPCETKPPVPSSRKERHEGMCAAMQEGIRLFLQDADRYEMEGDVDAALDCELAAYALEEALFKTQNAGAHGGLQSSVGMRLQGAQGAMDD